jgi:hypothetical protein
MLHEPADRVHLQYLYPERLVQLAHRLQVACTVVQQTDNVYYVVAESGPLPSASAHAVILQTVDHYTVFLPPVQPAPLIRPVALTEDINLFEIFNCSPAADWPRCRLEELLQAVCFRYAAVTQHRPRKHRKTSASVPSVSRMPAAAAHHLALCIDVLLHFLCANQSDLMALGKEASCQPTSKHLGSASRFHDWLCSHLQSAAEFFHVPGGPVVWFAPPEGAAARRELLEHISCVVGQAHGAQMVREKVAALPVHKYLLTLPGAVAKRVFKSMLVSLTSSTHLRMTFNLVKHCCQSDATNRWWIQNFWWQCQALLCGKAL